MQTKKRGFTLIELMVVISIIAVLSSSVLSSLSTARQKAIDAINFTQLQSYLNTLLTLRNGSGAFPIPQTAPRICLGKNGLCPLTDVHDPAIDSQIEYFLPGAPPINSPTIRCDEKSVNNMSYQCNGSSCTQIILYWCIQGNTICPIEGISVPSDGNTFCAQVIYPR